MSLAKLLRNELNKAFENDISVVLSDESLVCVPGENMKCSGYFDTQDQVLCVAIGRPVKDWFPIFVHESSHMDQFLDREDWSLEFDAADEFFTWLEGSVEFEDPTAIAILVARLELDAEVRSIKKMRQYDLFTQASEVIEYEKKSATYAFFYLWCAKHRRWYPTGMKPYEIPEIWESAPCGMDSSLILDRKIPPELEAQFDKFYLQHGEVT